ncbi:ATP-binding cassette sub-family G member 2 [Kalaharituber pfeilii]|nr:ATP-binding cassette sub-family G member 2 [Kalaharituber pfeilii]
MLFRAVLGAAFLTLPTTLAAYNYSTESSSLYPRLFDDRPHDCPPCFNCHLPAFKCSQFAQCREYDGRCECPAGFGGDDCLTPVCGSLADGKERAPREGETCECKDGWTGINCNLCTSDNACNAMVPTNSGGVCYKGGVTVKENHQMCDVTNRKILDLLGDKKPQVTFSCNAESKICGFQFWIGRVESFYCGLSECEFHLDASYDKNVTQYDCQKINCECVPGRMLCGEPGSIDISEFLLNEIAGPATFSCSSRPDHDDGCYFSEPAMNGLIENVFGDSSITLDCNSAECLHYTEVPGYTRPVKRINKVLIASVVAGSTLFVVLVILVLWQQSRKMNQKAGLGPIHLPRDDDDDAVSKLMADHKPATLMFENISYQVNGGRKILSGVHGVVYPGQLMAIMGASGAGKTTFLDILARKNKRGTVTGSFYINGETVSDEDFKNVVGFVDQEDTMMPTLTVYETILNSALLRLPRDMSRKAKYRRVMEVMNELGIMHIKDQIIGSEESGMRGISGGEKRRVGIACELVTSPSILFLDEPTSGLDSFNAYNVIECLVTLAKNYNRTVIFTIHQPRSNIVALFDQLILLAKGKMVYSGEYRRCQRYFDELGYACPSGFNIADYLVDLTMHASNSERIEPDEVPLPPSRPSTTQHRSGLSTFGDSIDTSSGFKNRKRGDSVKARQERQLFTRRTSGNEIRFAEGEEVALDDGAQAWRDVAIQRGAPRMDETDLLLPPSSQGSASGTDLGVLINSYANSSIAMGISEEIRLAVGNANGTLNPDGSATGLSGVVGTSTSMKGFARVGWLSQFVILSQRTWKNLYRNPMLMLTHYAIAIVLGMLCGYLFYGISDDIAGFQNRMGLFFFVLALFGFSTLTSLNVFASERLLFLRERANGYYAPITYFCSKVIFDIIPLRIIPPIIMGAIIYPMVGLVPEWPQFLKFIIILVLFNLSAAAICLFIGIVFKEASVANLVGSLVMLFSLLLAGLLLNHDSIPKSALWLQTVSIFHYGFEALIVNEVRYLTLREHKLGLEIEVPGATILSTFGFSSLAFWKDAAGLAIFSGVFIVLAYAAMHVLLVERR